MDENTEHSGFAARLSAAVNAHDLERVTACFTEDYVNETPAHPARGFRGRKQVRRNWTRLFEALPDITATILQSSQEQDRVWSEWEMRGRRRDGAEQILCGVIIFGLEGDRARSARFYLEPLDQGDLDIDGAVGRTTGSPAGTQAGGTP